MTHAAAIALALALGATPADPALAPLFRAGVEAYDAQDWDRAIAEWEKLRRFRVESPAVEYNLGNAWFKKGEYGRAVLHWERAARLDPSDDEALDNLRLVRGLLVDEVPEAGGPLVAARDRIVRLARPGESALVGLVAWELGGAALLVALLRPGPVRRAAGGVALLCALVAGAAGGAFWLQSEARADRGRLVVLTPAVEVRSGPGDQYTTVFTVHEGLVVRERDAASGWFRVRLPDGLDGWLPADTVERI